MNNYESGLIFRGRVHKRAKWRIGFIIVITVFLAQLALFVLRLSLPRYLLRFISMSVVA